MGQTFTWAGYGGIRTGVNWRCAGHRGAAGLRPGGCAVSRRSLRAPRGGEYVAAAVVTAVAYLGSLLAHELAHSLVARA